MMLEAVIDRMATPCEALPIGFLVRIQATFAAVGMKGIVLSDYDLHLAIRIQVTN